ncbi:MULTISPECIES: Holliday junction resolvase RecU [unclassified Granulicatella]|uniref:Holliday junction resolvase RecU n=1 Tax=unclassified Granulicatella TaxID=2630493 RepID=UPI0010748046|nr:MULTISPECIES: Holliday junction resolvase RecU [unclassified Granulicatella]MBF0780357.1 Holliday junction resolvase RecU [Granulicatella sp. 19428wC4_WM01]TFU95489.1 Holliday junction resolvase RecU [Granulicatella sp. WM01]
MPIHYPPGIFPSSKQLGQKTQYANRGMGFEEQINQSNAYYLQKNIAVIHKKPTPVQIVRVDYPKRSAAVIKEAYFRQASTTDYNGVFKGYYIDFEAKETRHKTSFPLINFHEHQVRHMEQCLSQEGITFILFKFSTLNRVFLLKAQEFISFWRAKHLEGKRKSIPLSYIEKYGYEIPIEYAPIIPYLRVVEKLIQQNNKF